MVFKSKLDHAKYTDVSIKPLEMKDVLSMITSHFPTLSPAQAEQLAATVLDKTMGLPFFIHQMLNTVAFDGTSLGPTTPNPTHRHSQLFSSEVQLESRLVANLPTDLLSILIVASFLQSNFSSTIVARFMKKVSLTVMVRIGLKFLLWQLHHGTEHRYSEFLLCITDHGFGDYVVLNLQKDDVTVVVNDTAPVTAKRATIETWLDDAVKRRLLACTSKHNYEFINENVKEYLKNKVQDEEVKKTIHYYMGKVLMARSAKEKEDTSLHCTSINNRATS